MSELVLTRVGLRQGTYEGILTGPATANEPPQVRLVSAGAPLATARLEPVENRRGAWNVSAEVPARALSDGFTVFELRAGPEDDALDRFVIYAGEDVEADLRAQVALLRAELDLLKSAFRRHCRDTGA